MVKQLKGGYQLEITKEKLESMYKSMTLDKLMEELDVSKPTIYRLLKANNIKLKGNEGNKPKVRVI